MAEGKGRRRWLQRQRRTAVNNGEGCTSNNGRGRRQTAMASEVSTTEGDGFGGSDGRQHDLRQMRRQLAVTVDAPTSGRRCNDLRVWETDFGERGKELTHGCYYQDFRDLLHIWESEEMSLSVTFYFPVLTVFFMTVGADRSSSRLDKEKIDDYL
ncbi:hypothetical protein Syun_009161 [Stephania yunnanensis]|uniref:Uncharacterized protein n=1 Tax=Stephania yunnanensis TaxID=152371 RepID=A0AAP0KE49_9MAGN